MLAFADRWLLAFHVEGAVGFQFAAVDLLESGEPLLVDDGEEVFFGQGLALHGFAVKAAIADQDGGAPLEEPGELA